MTFINKMQRYQRLNKAGVITKDGKSTNVLKMFNIDNARRKCRYFQRRLKRDKSQSNEWAQERGQNYDSLMLQRTFSAQWV